MRSTWSSWTGTTAAPPITGSWPTRPDVARGFYAAVCGYRPEVRDELLVFDGGSWTESGRLLRQIGGATFENLILPEKLKARDPGRRRAGSSPRGPPTRSTGSPGSAGSCFVGPPGNGKTHAIKALINETRRPCLYVKTLRLGAVHRRDRIRRVFARARECSPCLLVFEDLDALITDENRSFFLNELDGFAANAGILTIATTNHPDKLDPAILDRPEPVRPQVPLRPARPRRAPGLRRPVEPLAGARGPAHPGGRGRGGRADRGVLVRLPQGAASVLADGLDRRARAGSMDAVVAAQVAALREQMTVDRGSEAPGVLAPMA